MPPGGFGPPPNANAVATNPRSDVKVIPTKSIMTTPTKKEPSWMMSAAQNLVSTNVVVQFFSTFPCEIFNLNITIAS